MTISIPSVPMKLVLKQCDLPDTGSPHYYRALREVVAAINEIMTTDLFTPETKSILVENIIKIANISFSSAEEKYHNTDS